MLKNKITSYVISPVEHSDGALEHFVWLYFFSTALGHNNNPFPFSLSLMKPINI